MKDVNDNHKGIEYTYECSPSLSKVCLKRKYN